jgi:hypothetical protein
MTSAALELQKAMRAALVADAGLVSLLGAPRIFDDVPPGTPFPYVTFGLSSAHDWSTDTESGREHLLTLHVWSRTGGKKEMLGVMDEIERVLAAADLSMETNHLVDLGLQYEEARYEEQNDGYHGLLRYRAVTEPLA